MNFVIDPLLGLKDLPFGSGVADIIGVLGAPDFREAVESVVQHEVIEHLEFDRSNIICYIKGKDKENLVLNDIELYHIDCELFGVKVFDLEMKVAIALMAANDFPLLDKEIEGDITILSFNHCFVDFIYKKSQLKCIEISDFDQNFE